MSPVVVTVMYIVLRTVTTPRRLNWVEPNSNSRTLDRQTSSVLGKIVLYNPRGVDMISFFLTDIERS